MTPEEKRVYDAAHYAKNRERKLAQVAAYNSTHKDQKRAYDSAYRATNKEAISAKKLKYAAENKEGIRSAKAKYHEANRAKISAARAAYYKANRDKIIPGIRPRRLNKVYGLAPEDYEAMHRAQFGACAICGRLFDGWLHVDHKHIDGYERLPAEEKRKAVRGLLCKGCNSGLGYFREDIEALQRAIAYLAGEERP